MHDSMDIESYGASSGFRVDGSDGVARARCSTPSLSETYPCLQIQINLWIQARSGDRAWAGKNTTAFRSWHSRARHRKAGRATAGSHYGTFLTSNNPPR